MLGGRRERLLNETSVRQNDSRELIVRRLSPPRASFNQAKMATTLAVANAAVNPPLNALRPARHRPQRNEREKRRAAQAKKDAAVSAPLEDLAETPGQHQLDWLPLADAQSAPCPVLFSPDSA